MSGHDAVVLAAGGSRRLGRPKQMLTVAGETLIARTVRMVRATRPDRLVVVLGAEADLIAATLTKVEADVCVNPAWSSGLSSSLQAAARRLGGRGRPVLMTVVDQIGLTSIHLEALLAAHDPRRDTVSAYGEATGVPVVLRAETLAGAALLRGDEGFRRLWADTPVDSVRDDALARDLDTHDDIVAAIARGLLDPLT